jgi:hypothetical protein
MASPVLIHTLYEYNRDSVWQYPPSRTAGAFRGVAVAPLLQNPPCIQVYEWRDGYNNNLAIQPSESVTSRPKYAAISLYGNLAQPLRISARTLVDL